MARLKDLSVARGKDELYFDPEMILEKPGWNGRDMESPETVAHIRRMADCIKENGVEAFPPITIYQEDGKIYVSAGHCRRRAHILAKQEGAPIKGICCRADNLSEEDRVLDQLNSNSGLDLKPLEKSLVIKRLVAFGWTVAEVAKKTGNSSTHIENQLSLANAPTEVKNMVATGQVAARTAVEVVRKEGGEKGLKTLQDAVETAKEQGKTKATAKHLPKPSAGIDWKKYGPRMRLILEAIRDSDSQEELQNHIATASRLLAEIQ